MTFENPMEEVNCAEEYQDSSLDFLCALGSANDIQVEKAILAFVVEKLGFNPMKQKKIQIHLPSQLLHSDQKNRECCGINNSIVVNRKIEDIILEFNHEFVEWNFFLANNDLSYPVNVTTNDDHSHSIGADLDEKLMVHAITFVVDTTDFSTWWNFEITCGLRWFSEVYYEITFPELE